VKKVLVIGAVFILAGLWPTKAQRQVWHRESYATSTTIAKIATIAHADSGPAMPTRVSISSINLDYPIQNMGLDKLGRMDVPSGKTKNIGWYKAGTMPGEKGSAVLAAHVYAAFKRLSEVKIGDEVLITDTNGKQLKFIVKEKSLFELSGMSADDLFNDSRGRLLKLITCAGKKTRDERGYDQRLVLTAELQN
jgi:sortase (surface protein transpeptidase)